MKEKTFQRRDQVIEAALEEFTKKNYEKASLNIIIKNAGISKGTFYYHFENKEALYLYLLKEGTDAKWHYISEQIKSHNTEFQPKDIFDKFLYQAKLGAGFIGLYPKWHRLGQMFTKEKNNPIYKIALEYLDSDGKNMMELMVKEAIEKNELDKSYNEDFVIKVLSHMFAEFDQIFGEDSSKDGILKNLESYVKFMKYGLSLKD